ncbi:phage tail protein [Plantactinospora sp. GCM10030261]|uniref:phage tail protein n=1 Tax=Plantactinospora sp. GCM10030261 TaxID=3273420 RepID=UPI00360A8757
MRTAIANLPTPHPIGERLPALYLDDDVTVRLTEALDAVLAPVMVTLDCFAAYLDPRLAPEDFVEWLAGWVAFAVDESWSTAQCRELVANAVELHRWRGTKRGLAAHLRLLTGGEVDIEESGVCAWSDRAGGPVPGDGPPRVAVRVRVADLRTVDQRRLYAAVRDLLPAHVQVSVHVSVEER